MITSTNIENLKTIVSNLAYKDYKNAYQKSDRYLKGKYTPSGKERKFKGYSLSDETTEANELLQLTTKTNITHDEVESIKGYLLRIKLIRDFLLIPKYYYNN